MNDTILIVIVLSLFTIVISSISQMKGDIARINITLNKIAKQVGVTDPVIENIDDELKSLIVEGKKIQAIKKYRTVTGLGLKEAKDYVDSLSLKQF